ncbi:hypothetical protein F9B85_03410 [Heliorestis acidaminivorans]|uniref:Uncharacterized protein n=1 Tax=Heliorestis acidaminivorans TaxID=553427 RepID=A0A6I0F295_9FIRM|nr:hypothetical protein [Heliorestis acidaminivorans]KAB2953680.1 hypothetical protein F9B85_03410 [Heliorestis acidaminivorans]
MIYYINNKIGGIIRSHFKMIAIVTWGNQGPVPKWGLTPRKLKHNGEYSEKSSGPFFYPYPDFCMAE